MSLQAEGFRYIYRDGLGFTWMHPACIDPSDLDCTDMDNEAFEAIVQDKLGSANTGRTGPVSE